MTRPGGSGLSIRARLTLWYAASALATFLLFAVALRGTVQSTLRREFTAGVTSSAGVLQSFFRLEFAEYRDIPATLHHIAAEVVFPDRIVEFVRPDGSVALRTRAGRRPDSDSLTRPVRRVEVPLDDSLARGWTLRVFASAAPLERSLSRIDEWMLFGIPLGVLLAGTIGWWMAGRTLRPIGDMAQAAARMTADRRRGTAGLAAAQTGAASSAQRLPIDNPSDEIGSLGTRFNVLLDQVDAVLGQQRRFLADAAHELRTPVARMLGTVDLALLDAPESDAEHQALLRVRRDLDRTARLVDELLQLARADAAGAIHPVPGYLDDLVLDMVHAWMPVSERSGVPLVVTAIEEAPALLDRVQAERMIGILIDNALRYTPAGGRVEVSLTDAEGMACLRVTDTGIGISAVERARVFERFYRGASARAMSPEGSGLGLAIADWIAQAHGATLELVAADGGGTCAIVRFPHSATGARVSAAAPGAFIAGSPSPTTLHA